MKNQESQNLALFKFSLVAPLVNNTYQAASKAQYFREVATKIHTLPNGKLVRFSSSTIKKWFLLYTNDGFDALIPKARSDAGVPRALDEKAIQKIYDLKEQFPYITGKLVYQKLLEEGCIKKTKTSMSSVFRFLRENNLKRSNVSTVERKAFEMEYANDCWQGDSSFGPVIKIDGLKRQTYLILLIDDASRIISHAEFFFNDNAVNMQGTFKKAISKYGLPRRIFVDNGPSYRDSQLRLICASLGVALIYTKPYSPESKGKVERVFRTIKDNWMHALDWNKFDSLDTLNTAFNEYLNEKYMNEVHSSLKMTPRERYLKDFNRIKFVSPNQLDNDFLNRAERRVNNDATIKLNNNLFEVPQKYIGQKLNIRYLPMQAEYAYIFDKDNVLKETIYPLRKIDNSKIKRKALDYTVMRGVVGDD